MPTWQGGRRPIVAPIHRPRESQPGLQGWTILPVAVSFWEKKVISPSVPQMVRLARLGRRDQRSPSAQGRSKREDIHKRQPSTKIRRVIRHVPSPCVMSWSMSRKEGVQGCFLIILIRGSKGSVSFLSSSLRFVSSLEEDVGG
jgi:hypothetical protein